MSINFLKKFNKDTLHEGFLDFFSIIINRKIDDYSKLTDGTLIANILRLDLGEKPNKTDTDLHSFEPPEYNLEERENLNWIYIGHYISYCWTRLNNRLYQPIDTSSIIYSRFNDDEKDLYLAYVILIMFFDVTKKGYWDFYQRSKNQKNSSDNSGCAMPKPEETIDSFVKNMLIDIMFNNDGYFITQIDDLKNVNGTMEKDIKTIAAQSNTLKSQVASKDILIFNLNRDLDISKNFLKQKDNNIKDLERQITIIEQELKCNVDARKEFQNEAEEVKELLEKQQRVINDYKMKYEEAQTLYEKYKSDYETLIINNDKKATYEMLIEPLKKQISTFSDLISDLENKNNELIDSNKDLKKTNHELELKLKDLENTNDKLMRQIDLIQKNNQTRSEFMDTVDFRKKEKLELYANDILQNKFNVNEFEKSLTGVANSNKVYMYRLLCIELVKEIQFYYKEMYDMMIYFDVLKADQDNEDENMLPDDRLLE